MANESLTRHEELVDGRYPIGAEISRLGRSTVYETEYGSHNEPAVIKVRERDESGGDSQAAQWRNVMGLAHPNLLKIYDVGSSTVNDIPVTWAVMEQPDESLDGVLKARPLSPEEAREMLTSVVTALRFLHDHGFAHSCLSPSNVLAVGQQVKLSSDCVSQTDDRISAEEDIRAFGVLMVQALTQRVPSAHIPGEIPEPFREIARHCLDPDPATRWTAAEVLARLRSMETVRPLPAHQLHVQAAPVLEKKIPAVEAPAVNPMREDPEEETRDDVQSVRKIPYWIYAALAALLLIVFFVAGLRKKSPVEHVATPPPSAARQLPSRQAPPADVSTPPAPFSRNATPLAAAPAPGVAATSERGATGWSVIVAAYANREAAEKRMRTMAARWPRFNPTVLQPGTGRTHYVVVLGNNLSQDQADTLRKRAVSAGFPRDTYIKNLM